MKLKYRFIFFLITIIAISCNSPEENTTLNENNEEQVIPSDDNEDEDTSNPSDMDTFSIEVNQIGEKITINAKHIETSSDGNIIAVIEDVNDGGTVNVKTYVNENSVWKTSIENDILTTDLGEINSSLSMSQNGKFLAVGSSNRQFNTAQPDLEGVGIVRVYENLNNQWVQVGEDLKSGYAFDGFGKSKRANGIDFSADGSILAIGASLYDGIEVTDFSDNFGLVRVFKNMGGSWDQMGSDIIGAINTETGTGVALSEDGLIMAVGASTSENKKGDIKIYRFLNNEWVQIGNQIIGEAANYRFGPTLSLSANGKRLALSAPKIGDITLSDAKVYENVNDNWVQLGETIKSDGTITNLATRISLSANGSLLVLSSDMGPKFYKVTENTINQLEVEIESASSPMSLSSDGTKIIVNNDDGVIAYELVVN